MLQSDHTSVYWSPADSISVFSGSGDNGGSVFVSTNTEPVDIANFTGNITMITGGNETTVTSNLIWGVYPYKPTTSCDGTKVTFDLPSQQQSGADTFGDGQFPTMGRSTNYSLAFYNICSGLWFSVENEGIYSVKVKSIAGEKLNGRLNIVFDNNGKPLVQSIEGGSDEITVTTEDGSAFIPGKRYYAVFPPVTMTQGLTVTYQTMNTEATYTVSTSQTFTRSIFKYLQKKDSGLTFKTIAGNINIPDSTFKAYCVSHFDTNSDGEISHEEAMAVKIIECYDESVFIDTYQGIEYFSNLDNMRLQPCIIRMRIMNNVWSYAYQLEDSTVNRTTPIELDVSMNRALKYLLCAGLPIYALDVSQNTALTSLRCEQTQLNTLDVSKNTALTSLYCNSNLLSTLDVSRNTALTKLVCNSNQLSTLDVSKNTALTYLDCYDNQLSTLDVSTNTALTSLICNNNQLTTLDVSNNSLLSFLDCSPMKDINGDNLLMTLFIANGQSIYGITSHRSPAYIPSATTILIAGEDGKSEDVGDDPNGDL